MVNEPSFDMSNPVNLYDTYADETYVIGSNMYCHNTGTWALPARFQIVLSFSPQCRTPTKHCGGEPQRRVICKGKSN